MITKRTRVGLLYFIIVISALLLRVSTYLGAPASIGADSDVYWTCFIQIVIFGFVSIFGYIVFALIGKDKDCIRSMPKDFGIKKVSAKNIIRTIILAILMIISTTGISYVWQIFLSIIGYTRIPSSTDYSSIGVLFKEIALVALLPAIFEEVSHRGLLYSGYKECGWKFVIVSGLLFALMHQNIVQTAYTFYDGCILALVMFYTGSIWPSMIMHFLNNLVSVCQEYISQNGGPFSFVITFREWLFTTTPGYVVGVLLVLVSFVLIIFIFSRMRLDAAKEDIVKDNVLFENKMLQGVKPLYKDVFFIVCLVTGICATIFSLVWGILR